MKFCSTSWDRINPLARGFKPIPTGTVLIGLDGAAIIAEPCPRCHERSNLSSELNVGTCLIVCDACEYKGPEKSPRPTPEEATAEDAWIAWNDHAKIGNATAQVPGLSRYE